MSEQTSYPPPGWERDKLIAEKLGIHVVTWTARDGAVVGGTLRDKDGGDFHGLLDGEIYWQSEDPWGDCPRFSTTLNTALRFVADIGAPIYVVFDPVTGGFEVGCPTGDGGCFLEDAHAVNELPERITRLVLMWIDAKPKDGA